MIMFGKKYLDPANPEDFRRLSLDCRPAIRVERALLCLDCDSIFEANGSSMCPSCGSATSWALGKALNRMTGEAHAVDAVDHQTH